MAAHNEEMKSSGDVMDSVKMDLSSLVGREVIIFSEQFQGKPLKSKVILVNDRIMSLDRSGSEGLIDELTNKQKVIINFNYKKQRVSVNAEIRRSNTGRCSVILDNQVVPLTRRKFYRFNSSHLVKYAVLPLQPIVEQKFSNLRWIETKSGNFSSGGIYILWNSYMSHDTYLLMNIETQGFEFPQLVIGQVRYCFPIDNCNYHIGIEFIVKEHKDKYFPKTISKHLPPAAFEYTATQRITLDKKLSSILQMNGEQNERSIKN